MILYFRLFLTLAVPFLLGFCVVALIQKNRPFPFLERFSLAWGLGIGLLGLIMFILSLFGFLLNLFIVSSTVIPLIIILFSYLLLKKIKIFDLSSLKSLIKRTIASEKGQSPWLMGTEKTFILLIILKISYVFFDALVKPIVNFDDLWRQGCTAKIIFTTGHVFTELGTEVMGNHPYLNPLSQAWVYFGLSSWNDTLGKIIFPFLFASLLFIFYTHLRRYSPRLLALLFTYLLTSFHLMVYHAGTAYSDFMQTFYYSVAALYLFQWIRSKETPSLYFSAFLFGIGNFVKQGGIPLWLMASLVLFLYLFAEERKEIFRGIKFVAISTLVSSPWLFFYNNSFLMKKTAGILGKLSQLITQSAVTGADLPPPINLTYGNPTGGGIFYHLGKRMFTYADGQILWFVFILVLLFLAQPIIKTKFKYLLIIILLNLAAIIYSFMDPVVYQWLVDGTLVNRVMMYSAPVVLYFCALFVSESFKNLGEIKSQREEVHKFIPTKKTKK